MKNIICFFIILLIFLVISLFRCNYINNPNNIKIIVNKKNKLNKNYKPSDLILLNNKYSNDSKYMRKEAAMNFEKLSQDAYKLGYKIIAVSTYRSYNYQKKLFDFYVKSKGKKYALNCCAKPGHSEHQTGLAVDVMGSNNDYNNFENSIEFNWMKNNSYKYGFILRYPKGKEKITGFKYEPWHYRYVGKELAKILFLNNLTMEEYNR